jgi:hypothetical protein
MSKSAKKPIKQVRIVEDPRLDEEVLDGAIPDKADHGVNEVDLEPNAEDTEDVLI